MIKESAIHSSTSTCRRSREDRSRALRARGCRSAPLRRHERAIHRRRPTISIYTPKRTARDLRLRVYSALVVDRPVDGTMTDLLDEVAEYPDDPLFKAGAIKLTLDGVVDSHTAVMLEPYASRHLPVSRRLTPTSSTGCAVARSPRLAGDDACRRRSRGADGAQRLRARRALECPARARPAPSHRARRDRRCRRRIGGSARSASSPRCSRSRQPDRSDRAVVAEYRPRARVTRLGLSQHRRREGPLAFGSDWPGVA